MNRHGTTQILEHASSRIGDATNEGPLKTPGRRGLDVRNPNVLKTAEKKKLGLGGSATPSRMAPVQISKANRSAHKKQLVVFEDVTSPVRKEEEKDGEEEEDEEIETCAPASHGDRSLLFKSLRADHTLLPPENLDLEGLEDDDEKGEEEEKKEKEGVEKYFKSVYNLAENFDAIWDSLEVEAHDSDTEIESCEPFVQGRDYEYGLFMDFVDERHRRLEEVQLVDSDEYLAMHERWMENEGCWSDEENDENNQSI